jgi:hypothetical protein
MPVQRKNSIVFCRVTNQPIKLPAYHDTSGNPASGWSVKFIDTRRFASDQSAWIFFRQI